MVLELQDPANCKHSSAGLKYGNCEGEVSGDRQCSYEPCGFIEFSATNKSPPGNQQTPPKPLNPQRDPQTSRTAGGSHHLHLYSIQYSTGDFIVAH
jgi:hypothetical protein